MKLCGKAGVLALLAFALTGVAWADPYYRHHPRSSIRWSINIGAPVYGPFYQPFPPFFHHPFYNPPLVVVQPPAPQPIYIERASPQASALEPGYWYYCQESQAYYPYVKQCAGAWQPVAPQPPR